MVEETRRQREIAVGCKLVGHRPDVVVDAEDLLDDHDPALGRALRGGGIGTDLGGLGLKTNILPHEKTSRLRAALDMVMPRHSTGSPSGSESETCTSRNTSRAANRPAGRSCRLMPGPC